MQFSAINLTLPVNTDFLTSPPPTPLPFAFRLFLSPAASPHTVLWPPVFLKTWDPETRPWGHCHLFCHLGLTSHD